MLTRFAPTPAADRIAPASAAARRPVARMASSGASGMRSETRARTLVSLPLPTSTRRGGEEDEEEEAGGGSAAPPVAT